jgi:hypothetical protein
VDDDKFAVMEDVDFKVHKREGINGESSNASSPDEFSLTISSIQTQMRDKE